MKGGIPNVAARRGKGEKTRRTETIITKITKPYFILVVLLIFKSEILANR